MHFPLHRKPGHSPSSSCLAPPHKHQDGGCDVGSSVSTKPTSPSRIANGDSHTDDVAFSDFTLDLDDNFINLTKIPIPSAPFLPSPHDHVDDAEGHSSGQRNIITLSGSSSAAPGTVSTPSAPQRRHEDNDDQRTNLQIHLPTRSSKWYLTYLRMPQFWIALGLGQLLALCLTASGSLSTLLERENFNVPAFQSMFAYTLLSLVYSCISLYRYGLRKWTRILIKDGWKYFIFALLDVEGNYFIVMAYRYTNMLSIQIIDFWAIVVVMIVSFVWLHVRYRFLQYLGIIICCSGMALLIVSDKLSPAPPTSPNGTPKNPLKGDFLTFIAATLYGLSNCYEEFVISQRPIYEVLGQLGLWATLISGVQSAIFSRSDFAALRNPPSTLHTSARIPLFLTAYTAVLFIFYSLVPIFLRLTSSAYFNLSLLTADAWTVLVGLLILKIPRPHWLYIIAFFLIILGLIVYFLVKPISPSTSTSSTYPSSFLRTLLINVKRWFTTLNSPRTSQPVTPISSAPFTLPSNSRPDNSLPQSHPSNTSLNHLNSSATSSTLPLYLPDSFKPWLGPDQSNGIVGIGTARRQILQHSTTTLLNSP